MMRRITLSKLILSIALAVVTAAWLLMATLYDFYYHDPTPGIEGGRIALLSARTERTARATSIYPATAREILDADLGLDRSVALQTTGFFITKTGSLPQPVYGIRATLDFFKVLAPDQRIPELEPGSHSLILARRFAQRLFGDESAALGQTLWLNGARNLVSYVVDDIDWPNGLFSVPGQLDFYLLSDEPPETPEWVAGRVKPGIALAEVDRRLDAVLKRPEAWPPSVVSSYLTGSVQLLDDHVRDSAPWVPGLMASSLILLILALGTAVQLGLLDMHDNADRWVFQTILGATSRQVILRYLRGRIPYVLFGMFGGVAALLAALYWLGLQGPFPQIARNTLTRQSSWVAVWGTVALILVVGLTVLVPALWLRQVEHCRGLYPSLKGSGRANRLQILFPSLQLALLAAIVTAGYGVWALYSNRLENASGLRQDDLYYVRLYTPPEEDSESQVKALPQLLESLKAHPDIEEVAISHNYLPFLSDGLSGFEVDAGNGAMQMSLSVRRVSPNFFALLGMTETGPPLDVGRPDGVVVSHALARSLGFRSDSYPRSFRVGLSTVMAIGEVADTVSTSLTGLSNPSIYYPLNAQGLSDWPRLLVRSQQTGESIHRYLKTRLLDSGISVFVAPVVSASSVVHERLALTRFFYSIFLLLGAVIAFVAFCSVVVTIRREAAGRLYEMAVRRALGASRTAVGTLLLKRTLSAALIGTLAGAFLGTRLAEALVVALEQVIDPNDGVVAFLGVFAGAAGLAVVSYLPSTRMSLSDLLRKE